MVNTMVEGYITLLFRDLRKQANRCPTVNLLKLKSEKSRACGAYALQCLAGNNKYYCKNICFKEKLGSFSPYFFSLSLRRVSCYRHMCHFSTFQRNFSNSVY